MTCIINDRKNNKVSLKVSRHETDANCTNNATSPNYITVRVTQSILLNKLHVLNNIREYFLTVDDPFFAQLDRKFCERIFSFRARDTEKSRRDATPVGVIAIQNSMRGHACVRWRHAAFKARGVTRLSMNVRRLRRVPVLQPSAGERHPPPILPYSPLLLA